MIAYLCATPYHIFNAINTKIQFYAGEPVDLFVFNHMRGYQETAQRLRALGLFEHVYLIEDCAGSKNEHSFQLAHFYYSHFHAIKIALQSCPSSFQYDTLVLNFPDAVSNELFIRKIQQKRKTPRVFYCEDGIASYTVPLESFPAKLKLFLRLLGLTGFRKYIESCWYYRPELSQTKFVSTAVLSAPNAEVKRLVNQAFSFRENKSDQTKRFIFFEESFHEDGVKLNDLELLMHVAAALPADQCLLKKHPRSTSERVAVLGIEVLENNAPWEVYCLNSDFSSNVLISISSSALLSPKIIFEQEPTIIFLYLLLNQKTLYHNKELENHFENVRHLYTKANYYIPKTLEELDSILLKIRDAAEH